MQYSNFDTSNSDFLNFAYNTSCTLATCNHADKNMKISDETGPDPQNSSEYSICVITNLHALKICT